MLPAPQKNDKRSRLISAAVFCFHQSGYARVSLADIAAKAEVPLGNVYYYFKTKASLAEAVVNAWIVRQAAIYTEIDVLPNPRQRLERLLQRARNNQAVYAEFGCPLANLARDLLAAEEPDLSALAGTIYANFYEWATAQFMALGYAKPDATAKAGFFIATLQGGILMAHVHSDGSYVDRQAQHLQAWLGNLEKEAA